MSDQDSDLLGSTPGFGRSVDTFKELCVRDVMIRLRGGMPAHVVSFSPPVAAGPNSKPAMVRVQPHFYTVVRMNSEAECTDELLAQGWVAEQETDGWIRKRPLPEVPNCPVAYVGPASMTARGPLRAGESGWLLISDRSLDKWTQTGGPVDPVWQDMHILNDAVFLPGLRYGTNSPQMDTAKYTIGYEDGTVGLAIDAVEAPTLPNMQLTTTGNELLLDALATIKHGMSAVLGVARQTDDVTATAAMTLFMTQVVTALTTIAAAVPVVIVPPVIPAGAIGLISTASTKVLAE